MLLIRNAKLLDQAELTDILISREGKYLEIAPGIDVAGADGVEIIDAAGMLACPTFVNTHMHFDKAYTALQVKARAVRAIRECVMYGTTKLRTNVDIDNMCGLIGLEGVLAAREETKDICDLQIVAFPQEGIYCNEGTEKLMWQAMEMGADVAGGMPAAEWLDELKDRHVDLVFEIAEKYGCMIDMHIDQSKDMFDRTLEYTAWKTLQKGWAGRVTGGHCTSIAYQNQSHAIKVMKLLAQAGVNVCTNTQVLAIMGIDAEPRTRGVTRIREMVDMGINVATAQDTICDGFHLYGTGDPLD